MKTFLIAGIILSLLITPCSAKDICAENVESFDLVWHTVNNVHFDPAFGGVDWKAAYDRYGPQIGSSCDIENFNRIVNQMLFELELSHLLVATETTLKTYIPTLFAEGSTGIDVRWVKNQAVITNIRPGSPGQSAELKPGDVIKEIDGNNVDEIIRHAIAMPPYNDRNLRNGIANYLVGRLDGLPNTSVSIVYEDKNSRIKKAKIDRRSRGIGKIISDAMPPVFVEFEARRLKGDIGYMWFNHFADPVDKSFLKSLEEMRDTRGLIIDVRSNPGGYFRVLDTMVEQLITEAYPLYRFRFREKTIERNLKPSKTPYKKPVVVLIDETSMSSSELFAACLQAIGRVVIVGERSPGYLLGANWKRLPNGLSFMHTILQPIPYGGRIIEGNGVKPDIEIKRDREKLQMGRDPQLEAAVAYILRRSLR